MTDKEITELTEEAYDMNLQNLSDRLTENECFKEGIEVGIRDLLEAQQQVNDANTSKDECTLHNVSISKAKEYAVFCVECDRKSLPLLEYNDWIELN